jgi:hypothetical protein
MAPSSASSEKMANRAMHTLNRVSKVCVGSMAVQIPEPTQRPQVIMIPIMKLNRRNMPPIMVAPRVSINCLVLYTFAPAFLLVILSLDIIRMN